MLERSKFCLNHQVEDKTHKLFSDTYPVGTCSKERLEPWLNFNLKNSKPGIEIAWCTQLALTSEVLENSESQLQKQSLSQGGRSTVDSSDASLSPSMKDQNQTK